MSRNFRIVVAIPMSILIGIASLMAITEMFPSIADNAYLTCGVVGLVSFTSFFVFYWLTLPLIK